MTSPSLFLVRHAPTAFNARGVFQGGTDVEALPLPTPETYRVWPVRPRIIRTSPLRRALSAVEVLFPGESYAVDPRLAERSMGELEGLDHASVAARWPDSFVDGVLNSRFSPPGGESLGTFAGRVVDVLRGVAVMPGDCDLYLVTHNGWIRTALFLNGELDQGELFVQSVPFLEPMRLVLDVELLASDARLDELG